MTREEQTPEPLPELLVTHLKQADVAPPLITAKTDRAMIELAREQFSTRAPGRRKSAPVWFAVAATVLMAIYLVPGREESPPGTMRLYADVDASGQIDIADVLALARGNEVSQDELGAFAMRIVSLGDSKDAS